MNLNIPTRIVLPAALFGLGMLGGLGLGWKLYHPKPGKTEPAAPAVRQQDGSLVLERKPLPANEAPKHPMIPKGMALERVVQVKVQPTPTIPAPSPMGGPATPGSGTPSPKPVEVDLALVRDKAGNRRVIASSPDGLVVGGIDVPVGPPAPVVKIPKWAVGGLYSFNDKTYGAYVRRAAGPFEVGLEALQVRAPILAGGGVTTNIIISAGIRF